jgi:hypothetical protein
MRFKRKGLFWSVMLFMALLGASALLYLVQFKVFRRFGDTLFYLLQDFAFLPVQVLLVTFVLNALLTRREKKSLLQKLYMVIGAFFSQTGNRLLERFLRMDSGRERLLTVFAGMRTWSEAEITLTRRVLLEHGHTIEARAAEMQELKDLLRQERGFLLGLVENPNLLEHESFTELLLAVFHLVEELENRGSLSALPAEDLRHLEGDVQRAYRLLAQQWLDYAPTPSIATPRP